MSRGVRPVRVAVAAVALLAIPLLMLVTAVANWVAVEQTVQSALGQWPEERYFIEAYESGARTQVLLGAVPQAMIAAWLVMAGSAAWLGLGWGRTLAVTVPWLALGCGYGVFWVNPMTMDLAGDPDGWSLAARHFPGWHSPVQLILVVAITLCCVLASLFVATSWSSPFWRLDVRLSKRRSRMPP